LEDFLAVYPTKPLLRREHIIQELSRALPTIACAGFLLRDCVSIWQAENDRVFAELGRKPRPAAIPAPTRAALPAKPKPPVVIGKEPAPRPARVIRRDGFPTDGQHALIVFIRGGAELRDGTTAGIGDEIALPTDEARQLVLRGAADYATAPVSGDGDANFMRCAPVNAALVVSRDISPPGAQGQYMRPRTQRAGEM
jgi:hypothetical protein